MLYCLTLVISETSQVISETEPPKDLSKNNLVVSIVNSITLENKTHYYYYYLKIMEMAAETACYLGASLSALIAYRIYGMPDKTFINKMFLLYFAVDAILGTLNTFLLFRLQRFGRIYKIIKISIWQLI